MSETPTGLSADERETIDKLFKRLPVCSHYELLGITRESETGEIINGLNQRRRRFDLKRLAGVPGPEYTARIDAVLGACEEAAATLLDPVRRFIYDQELSKGIPTRRKVNPPGARSDSIRAVGTAPIASTREPTPVSTSISAPNENFTSSAQNQNSQATNGRSQVESVNPPPAGRMKPGSGTSDFVVPPPLRRPGASETEAPSRRAPAFTPRPPSVPPPPHPTTRPPSIPPPDRRPSSPRPQAQSPSPELAAQLTAVRREVHELATELERVTVALQLCLAQWLEPAPERLDSMARAMATLNGARGTVLIQEARAEEDREQWATAADLWIRAARARSDDPSPRAHVAECLRRLGDFEGAKSYAEQALALDPDCAEAHATRALVEALLEAQRSR